MLPKASLKFALAAGLAGLLVGYTSRRGERRAATLGALQGVEWFLSAGGATLLTGAIRRVLEDEDVEITERLTEVEQTVVDRAAGR